SLSVMNLSDATRARRAATLVRAARSAAPVGTLEALECRQMLAGTPYPGPNPASLPGLLEAENFDAGGEGVGYHQPYPINNTTYRSTGVDLDATTDTNPGAASGNGFDIASVHAGDWLAYTVNIPTAGTYSLDFRVASQGTGGNFHVEID